MQSPPHRGGAVAQRDVVALDIGGAKTNAAPTRVGGAGALRIHAVATAPLAALALKAIPEARGKTLVGTEHEHVGSEA
ncbi:hypothetical protein ABXS69_08780 [Actinomyces timonensis]|uniref:ROK family protein n=1 Tax=Actinomyces timonensis TaxID=1288391 RepID=A0AAU8N0X0_9ACTO